jgi:hypothetical protein
LVCCNSLPIGLEISVLRLARRQKEALAGAIHRAPDFSCLLDILMLIRNDPELDVQDLHNHVREIEFADVLIDSHFWRTCMIAPLGLLASLLA